MTTELADLPPGYTARRPTIDDAEAILALVHAQERATIGNEDSTLPEVRELLSLRCTPPETDHWLVMHGEVANAWAMVIDDFGGEQIEIDVYADPTHPRAVRETLYDLLLERVREHATSRPNREVTVSVGVHVGDEHSAAALLARGFAVERRFNRLRIELEPGRPFPTAPDGVALQAFDPGSVSDWRDWNTLDDESFSDHWGHETISHDAFRQSVDTEEDPELDRWRFALVDGIRAGICQISGRFATEGGGWIRTLGVVASSRRRVGAGPRRRTLPTRARAGVVRVRRTEMGGLVRRYRERQRRAPPLRICGDAAVDADRCVPAPGPGRLRCSRQGLHDHRIAGCLTGRH